MDISDKQIRKLSKWHKSYLHKYFKKIFKYHIWVAWELVSQDKFHVYLLLKRELRTIKLSSRNVMISAASPPCNNNSPLALKFENDNIRPFQSFITIVNLASMSFSFTAEIHTSYKIFTIVSNEKLMKEYQLIWFRHELRYFYSLSQNISFSSFRL